MQRFVLCCRRRLRHCQGFPRFVTELREMLPHRKYEEESQHSASAKSGKTLNGSFHGVGRMGCRRRRSRRHPIPAPRTTGKERDQESCNDYLGPGTAGRQSGGCFSLIRFRGWAGSTGTRMIARGLPPTCQIRKASTCTLTSSTTHSVGPIQQARMVVGPAPPKSVRFRTRFGRKGGTLAVERAILAEVLAMRTILFSIMCGASKPGTLEHKERRRRNNECLFGILALETEPGDPPPRSRRTGRAYGARGNKGIVLFLCRFLWIEGLSDNRRACSSMVKQGTHNRAEGYFAPFFVHPH